MTKTKKATKRLDITKIPTPYGFTKKLGWRKNFDGTTDRTVTFTTGDGVSDDTTVITINAMGGDDYYVADGHVDFKTKLGLRTLDRRGVEDSFYVEKNDTLADVELKIANALAKVARTRASHLDAVVVPLWGFVLTPDEKTVIVEKFKRGGTHTFRPAGFGVGYDVTGAGTKRRVSRFAEWAPKEVTEFFGAGGLLVERLDCD